MMDGGPKQELLDRICREHGILAVYLFGSRADDGLRLLAGDTVDPEGSDLDVGVAFRDPEVPFRTLGLLQVDFEDLFEPLRVDLVPLHRVDPIFQFNAIDGHRIAAPDSTSADFYELQVMSEASELLPIQRQLERDFFGVGAK
jgi:predicted nucleotidyltransferase